jgi:hypothetical protein
MNFQCDLHHFSYLYSVTSNFFKVPKLNKTTDRPHLEYRPQPAYQTNIVAAYGPKNTAHAIPLSNDFTAHHFWFGQFGIKFH